MPDWNTQPPPVRAKRPPPSPPPPEEWEPEERPGPVYDVEPWYYRWLETFAKILTWVTAIAFGLFAFGWIIALIVSQFSGSSFPFFIELLKIAFWYSLAFISFFCSLFLLRIAVDVGRNVRDIRAKMHEKN